MYELIYWYYINFVTVMHYAFAQYEVPSIQARDDVLPWTCVLARNVNGFDFHLLQTAALGTEAGSNFTTGRSLLQTSPAVACTWTKPGDCCYWSKPGYSTIYNHAPACDLGTGTLAQAADTAAQVLLPGISPTEHY